MAHSHSLQIIDLSQPEGFQLTETSAVAISRPNEALLTITPLMFSDVGRSQSQDISSFLLPPPTQSPAMKSIFESNLTDCGKSSKF